MVRPSKYMIPMVAALLFLCSPPGLGHDPNLTVIIEYNEILDKDPDHLETLRARGSTLRALELFDSALIDLERSDQLDPGNPENLGEIGMCHYHLGELDLTTDYLDRANTLLLEKMESGEWDMERAMPVARELWEYRFHNFIDLECYEDALVEGERLATLLEGKISFECDMADVYVALDRAEEALPFYLKALEANCAFERFCVGAANCYLLTGRAAEAMEVLKAWRETDPEDPLCLYHQSCVARAYLDDEPGARQALAEAEAMLRPRIDEEEWPDIENVCDLARVLQALGRFQEAWDLMEGMMEDYRGHWAVVHLQGINAHGLGRPRIGRSLARESLLYKRLNPGDWLQVYDLVLPREPEPEAEKIPERDSEAQGPQRIGPVYLVSGVSLLLIILVLTYYIMRKRG